MVQRQLGAMTFQLKVALPAPLNFSNNLAVI
jgi:hypothetical protein